MRRRRVILGLLMLMFGLLAFLQMVGKPRFDSFHGSDVTQLTGAGACFGFGVAALWGSFRLRDEQSVRIETIRYIQPFPKSRGET